MTCTRTTSKICLTVIGILFWGAAASLIFLGSWVFHTYNHFSELTTANLTLIPAGILIIVGIFLFFLGCIGCIAACKESKCLLTLFFSLLLVVLTAEVIASVLGYLFKEEITRAVDNGLKEAMNKYNSMPTTSQHQIDYLQSELKCCGINNASDWASAISWSVNHTDHVPLSCCKVSNVTGCNTNISSSDIFSQGCGSLLDDKFRKNLVYAAGVAISFAVIQLLGMICSCILICHSSEVRYEILGGPNLGLRV